VLPAPEVVRTARLHCERFTLDHVAELALLDADPNVQATVFGSTYTYDQTRERTERRTRFWDENGYGDYVVRLHDGTFIGTGGLFPSHQPGAIALGYTLLPEHWGQGYATELAISLAAVAEQLEPTQVVAIVLETNLASRRVLEKAGFALVGPYVEDPGTVLYRFADR
jgi:RimJ/RimL family protein N-acetyltransferase